MLLSKINPVYSENLIEYEDQSVSVMPSFNAKSLPKYNSVTIEKLPTGDINTIQLNYITTTSDNNGIYRGMFQLKSVSDVAVIFC